MSIKLFYLVAAAAVVGCASPGTKPDPTTTTTGRYNFLSADEVVAARAEANSAYDAIARLRPNWLAARGVTSLVDGGSGTEFPVVYVDGQRYGEMGSLRNIQAYQVGSMQYYDVTQAGATFGIRGGSSGVIEVRMKGPRTYP